VGIFGKSNKQSEQKAGTTIIADGTFIKGGLDTKGSVHIDGKFEGVIVSGKTITVGKSGEIYGEVRANNLVVNGFLDGLIDCDEVQILPFGKIIGKMNYKHLIIEQNGIFEGEGKMKNSTLVSRFSKLESPKYEDEVISSGN